MNDEVRWKFYCNVGLIRIIKKYICPHIIYHGYEYIGICQEKNYLTCFVKGCIIDGDHNIPIYTKDQMLDALIHYGKI